MINPSIFTAQTLFHMSQLEKDNKIIADNPGKEPYELLHMGLSEEAYQRIVKESEQENKKGKGGRPKSKPAEVVRPEAKEEEVATKEPQPEQAVKAVPTIVVQPEAKAATPNISAPAKFHKADGSAVVLDTKTGKQVKLSRAVANRIVKKKPHLKIVG